VWKTAARKYAIPILPGEWQVLTATLILRPFGFIARGVGANNRTLGIILEPLFMPLDYEPAAWSVAPGSYVPGVFPYHRLSFHESEAEKYMHDLAGAVVETVLPYITQNGSLEGYFDLCRRYNADHPNQLGAPHILYRQAATAVILERPEDAEQAARAVQQAIDAHPTDDRDWVRRLHEQAGAFRDRLAADPAALRAELISGMDEQKRRRKLPLSG
jgi:hypothetical protein